MKKSFVWTLDELEQKLTALLEKWEIIVNVTHITDLVRVDSMCSDNLIRVFIIETKDNG